VTAARCGTPSGWSKHQKQEERPCDACARAKSDYDKRWRAAPERTQKSRLSARAQARAATRLRAIHPGDWANLYAEALDEIRAENPEVEL